MDIAQDFLCIKTNKCFYTVNTLLSRKQAWLAGEIFHGLLVKALHNRPLT